MKKRLDIIGIGDADCDIQLEVDHFPQHDEKVKARIIGQYPGGMISNFLSAAALFGSRCGAVVRMGQDAYGKAALEDLQRRGIETDHCVIKPDENTYFCITSLDKTGEKSMLVCMSHPTHPEPKDVSLSYLESASFVHMLGTNPSLVLPVARAGKERGYLLSIDIEKQAVPIPEETVQEICSLTHIAFPNKAGLDYFTGCGNDLDSGTRRLLEMGVKIVVVTLGAEGVYVKTAQEDFSFPAFQVPVKDTTGAGDTFNACFLSSYLRGHRLEECAQLATAAAAFQIQSVGARPGMIDYPTALAFLKEHGSSISPL